MRYIDALNLINLAIKNNILKEEDGKVFVFRSARAENQAGWYLDDKSEIARELAKNVEGQKLLIDSLSGVGVEFKTTKLTYLG